MKKTVFPLLPLLAVASVAATPGWENINPNRLSDHLRRQTCAGMADAPP